MDNVLDHTKKYAVVNGCFIEMSFADKPNTKLYSKLCGILLNSYSHICTDGKTDVKSDEIVNIKEEQ